nr:hypothetical protein [Tanacetum cinerariifolium]
MDTESPYKDVQPTIILGRPFLATIDARINCRISAMDIAFSNKKLRLNVFNSVNSLTMNGCYQVDVINEEVQKYTPRMLMHDPLELFLTDENEEILDTAKATLPKNINLTGHVSAVLSSSLPPKFKDPGAPLILVVVGNIAIKKALLDLGASINILPASLVDKYDLGTL